MKGICRDTSARRLPRNAPGEPNLNYRKMGCVIWRWDYLVRSRTKIAHQHF